MRVYVKQLHLQHMRIRLIHGGLLALQIYLMYDLLCSRYGWFAYTHNKHALSQLIEQERRLVKYQQKLELQISYLHQPVNIDYLQTYAMNEFNHIPKGWSIIPIATSTMSE